MKVLVPIKFQKLDENVRVPKYAHEGDSGMDVCSNIDIHIRPQETICIPTGLKIEIPFGYEIQIRPRSGLSLHTKIRISNSPATIDCTYRGELGIIITNTSLQDIAYTTIFDINTKNNDNGIYKINKYDRLAQLVLAKVEFMEWEEDSLSSSERIGGFGSTGTKLELEN